MQVEWQTIEELGATARSSFLNFPIGMAIQRLLLTKPDEFTPGAKPQREVSISYFGSLDWFDAIYKRKPNLFGDDPHEKIGASGEALLEWYRSRLRNIFGYVSKAALIRNTRRGHLYYLLLASPNATGAKPADHVLSTDRIGPQTFTFLRGFRDFAAGDFVPSSNSPTSTPMPGPGRSPSPTPARGALVPGCGCRPRKLRTSPPIRFDSSRRLSATPRAVGRTQCFQP